ncbi:right-handed parallel beta-helix repeat-containing protein [uncultured Gimesia sp.]|uniref:right-handed parallel beta-helix repeat-containing protein n=1 Tax=uncultured Gimesia sp. TaxID=1678688 RepID=UPI00262F21A3|nr:right-handed parallel beta-helix repeat-containing protein [uncultured Gimesia sp.]
MISINNHQLSNLSRLPLQGLLVLFTPFWGVTHLAADTLSVPADHKTIQAAVDVASKGDTVLVSAGTYKERILLKEGLTLKSTGDETKGKIGLKRAETTIIDGGGEQGAGAGVTMAPFSTLDGFTVTNVGQYDDDKWNKHHATQGEQQSHEHIGEPGTAGIGVIGVTCTIKNNIVHHIGYTGIAIQGVAGKRCAPHVYRNFCYRNMGGGIGSMQKSTAIIEQNHCFENFYAGIGHDDASPTVINNTCYENIRAGIGISEGSRALVRGNKCFKNRRAGIGIRTGAHTRPVIEENQCYENEMAGIGTREEASPTIRNNRCYKNKLAGIGSRTHATPTILGNECYENGQSGIGQQSDAVTMLINNHCHHNKSSGIGFATCESGRSTVINNRIIDNGKIAVGVNAGWTVQLSGNELSQKNGLPPIVMVFNGADVTLTSNTIRGGGVAGIRAAGKVRAENNEFAGTSLRKFGPPNFAIWALPGSDLTMNDNKIHSWRHALQASEANIFATGNKISQFHKAAFVVQNSASPASLFGNTAISINPEDKVLSISGKTGIVNNNILKRPTD